MGPVEEVFSYCGTMAHDIEVEDLLVGSLKFKSGALGLIEANTTVYPGLFARLDIYGKNGTAVIVDDEIEFFATKDGIKIKKAKERMRESGTASPKISYDLHKRQLEDIVDSILSNRKPRITGVDGRNTLAVVTALYESCKTGKSVKVNIRENS